MATASKARTKATDNPGIPAHAPGVSFVIGIKGKGQSRTSKVQSVLFSDRWTQTTAKAWLKEHGFKYGEMDDVAGNMLRFRQEDPQQFDDFRTIKPDRRANPEDNPSSAFGGNLHQQLVHAVTEYDRKQQGKRGYNMYALPQYLARVKDVEEDVAAGASVRKALTAGFSGRLLDAVLKATGEGKSSREEQIGGYVYRPSHNPEDNPKDPAEMTAGEINKALDKIDAASSKLTSEFISAGRGHERPSEYLKMTDPLAMRARELHQKRQTLQIEKEMRYGPGAPSRLPKGFGPRKRNPEAQSAEMYESFHGSPSTGITEVVEEEHYHGNLAELGELVELGVETLSGYEVTLTFNDGQDREENPRPAYYILEGNRFKTGPFRSREQAQRSGQYRTGDKVLTYKQVMELSKEGKLVAAPGWAGWSQNPGRKRNLWPFSSFTKTTIRHVGTGRKYGVVAHARGYAIYKREGHEGEPEYIVPKIDPESRFESLSEAKRFIGAQAKGNPKKRGPIGSFLKSAGDVVGMGKKAVLDADRRVFNPDEKRTGPVILASNEAGTQLYVIGGSQELDLDKLKITGHEADKEFIVIGEIVHVVYRTTKVFKDGKPETYDYQHEMGEESGNLPTLIYDRLNERLVISGGSYFIDKPLLSTSPGLED